MAYRCVYLIYLSIRPQLENASSRNLSNMPWWIFVRDTWYFDTMMIAGVGDNRGV